MKKTVIKLLNELRYYIIMWLFIYVILFIFCFCFREKIYNFITIPLKNYFINDYKNIFVYTSIFETFTTDISLSLYCSFIVSFPIILFFVYKFISKSLYKSEKKIVLPIFILSFCLFILSMFITYSFLLPRMVKFFVSFSTIAKPMLKISEYVFSFFYLIIAISITFQFPIILIILSKFGFIDNNFLDNHRKIAIVFIFTISAIITPPDVFSQILVAIFLILIYEITNVFIKKFLKN